MPKFRKKPVVIEAIQWKGNNGIEIMNFTNAHVIAHNTDELKIETLEGVMTASKGDWIIKGVNGEFYPCKPDIFDKTYDKVEE